MKEGRWWRGREGRGEEIEGGWVGRWWRGGEIGRVWGRVKEEFGERGRG